jgi:hypothetical protein
MLGTLAMRAFHRWPNPRRLNARSLLSRGGRRRLANGIVFGVGSGAVLGFATWLARGPGGFSDGFALGLAGGLIIVVCDGLDSDLVEAAGPRDVIHANLAFGLMVGLTTGLALGLAWGDTAGIIGGSAVGLMSGLTLGSAAAARYLVAVTHQACHRRLPWRLGAFLDWANAAGLTRTSGIAYQFRHAELQQWLESGKK